MNKIFMALMLVSFVGLSACNTAVGLAQDTYGAGKFVVNQITDDE